jgi:ATP-dependent helicase HrpB
MSARVTAPASTSSLPIDASLDEIRAGVRAGGAVVVEAPPGAGKTTRVPRALLEAFDPASGEIWVLEPRRLAARLAATRVADEMGERVGETIGYAVRFDEVAGPKTRVRFLTEGLFQRRLLAAPDLPGVAAVVLDEIHERHVATDLALAWLHHLRQTTRPDLGLVAMSATIDAEPVREFLSGSARGATHVRSPGRRFDVQIEHLDLPEDRPIEQQVAAGVRRALRDDPGGDVLVFLPGAGEIRRAQSALADLPGLSDTLVLPLHGDMPLDDQARAVRPAGRRKIVLATNVAESSITVDGVVTVVDSGVARIATSSPWTGFPSLTMSKISRASAAQRAGRAGRTRPGRALRLYSKHDFDQRREHDLPEIARSDLAELALMLAAIGITDADQLGWLEPPPPTAWGVAHELLARLGAIDAAGRLTDTGRQMARYPVHPRLGRLIVEGHARGAERAACVAAALVSERDIRTTARSSFSSGPRSPQDRGAEIVDLVDLYREAEAGDLRPEVVRRLELDRRAVDEVRRVVRSLAAGGGRDRAGIDPAAEARALRLAMLAAFPDRVARRRAGDRRAVVLAAGGSATLGFEPSSDWIVAIDVAKREGGTRSGGVEVRLAANIEPEWVLDLFPDRVEEIDRRAFNPDTGWIERTTGLGYGALMLEQTTEPAPADDETAVLLAEAALARGVERLPGGEGLSELGRRLAFARATVPDAEIPGDAGVEIAALVRAACVGRRSLSELEDLVELALAGLPPRARQALERIAPARVTLASGRSVPVHYDASAPPWIESRLQDFFGTSAPPSIGAGRFPLTLHLLAPNGRAVQVTSDLPRFWREHYPALRRELGRRYPKHSWPEDGATARPPPPPHAKRPPR